jgi:hypothetical protein
MKENILALLAVATLVTTVACAQVPAGVDSSGTGWVVDQTAEIVVYVLFDPATVADSLPSTLRFISIGELAESSVAWAVDYLAEEPSRGGWGISFLEIARMGTFLIDGRAPSWPQDGAIALWAARVALSDSSTSLDLGQPLLLLEFWLPDSEYVAFMRGRGYYATFGDVRLGLGPNGRWWGTIGVEGLTVAADCMPAGPISGGAASSGMQTFFPPNRSSVKSSVSVAFAGHRIQTCTENSTWEIEGAHALAQGAPVGGSTFQFGYHLVGGVLGQ